MKPNQLCVTLLLQVRRTPTTGEAEREYRAALRFNPKSVSAMANLGVLLVRSKHEDDAIKMFESVLRIVPDHPQATINLGLLYSSRKNYERAVQLLTRANELQPNSFDILMQLGISLYNLNRLDDADNTLRKAVSVAPNTSAELFYFLGLIAFSRNQDEAAGELLEKAVALKANYAEANFMLGELFAKHKDFSIAKNYYEKALSQGAGKAVYHIRLGGTYLYLRDFNRAFDIFKNASERFPSVPEIHYFFSIAARAKGNSNLSLIALKKALAINPNYADALALFGAIQLDRGDLVDAEKLFRKALLSNSNNYNANYHLGRLLVKQQNYVEALPLLEHASKILPESAEVHYQLFLTYSRLNRSADARQEFDLFKKLSQADEKSREEPSFFFPPVPGSS
jgi:protein O-GlcNAc transferase